MLISSFVFIFSCKKDDDSGGGKVCLKCAGEATICEGDKDEDGNTVTKEELELAYAFLVAFEADCTLD